MLKVRTERANSKEFHAISQELSVAEIRSVEVQQFIDDLLETAETTITQEGYKTVGLAAVQVGQPVRLLVAKNLHSGKFFAYLNPKLELLGEATDLHTESCLSIPGVITEVSRHKRIRLNFFDRYGNPKAEKFDGFEARIIQHEYDHLEGILFTERARTV